MKKLEFIDLCAGIGGFRLAFEDKNTHCNLTCEIDKFCATSYLDNYGHKNTKFINDITKIETKNLDNFDILCGGFPCQSFSKGGKQKGFNDIRGTIFFNIAEIIKDKRPSCFLLENVKNLKSHDKKNTYKVIKNKLDELDYWYADFLINAQYFVPQKRERIYILGLNKEKYTQEDFLLICNKINQEYKKIQQQPLLKIHNILEKNVHPKYTLSDKLWLSLQLHAKKHKEKGNGFGFGLIDPSIDISTRTLTARYYKDGSEILIKQIDKNPRKLTPRECARLMGFPESFNIIVSDTQAYKQFGNSVVVPVVKLFADNIKFILSK